MGEHVNFVGVCPDCDRPMVSKPAWEQGIRPEGHTYSGGFGYCRRDYLRRKRREPDYVPRQRGPRGPRPEARPLRTRDEVLEDYVIIKDDVSSVRQAADRMGMSFAALDMALYRARKDGIEEAAPPVSQRLRAS